jgi:small nuclear ribonucleoprotein (snRNP)-like protein
MTELPQMWELAAYRQAAEIAEAEEQVQLAAAVAQSAVTLTDRARGATGSDVLVRVVGGTAVSGTLELATDECLVVAEHVDHRLIPTASVVSLALAQVPTALPARGLERTGMRAILRARLGTAVRLELDGDRSVVGVLVAVGRDYIAVEPLSAPPDEVIELIPTSQLRWLGWREAESVGPDQAPS